MCMCIINRDSLFVCYVFCGENDLGGTRGIHMDTVYILFETLSHSHYILLYILYKKFVVFFICIYKSNIHIHFYIQRYLCISLSTSYSSYCKIFYDILIILDTFSHRFVTVFLFYVFYFFILLLSKLYAPRTYFFRNANTLIFKINVSLNRKE